MMNATQDREHHLRMAAFYDNEALIARYRFDDAETANIFDSGADVFREWADHLQRLIEGAK